MAGFVTWLRRQNAREDSVGALSRELIREDPVGDVWLLEGFRERLMAKADPGWRDAAFAQATVEWSATAGVPLRRREETAVKALSPQRVANVTSETSEQARDRLPVHGQETRWRMPAAERLTSRSGIHSSTT